MPPIVASSAARTPRRYKEGAYDYLVKLLDPDERAHLLSRLKQLPVPPGRGPGGRVSAGCVLHGGIYSR